MASTIKSTYQWRDLPWLVGVAALTAILAKLVLTLYSSSGLVTIFWPGAGVSLAAVLLGGRKYWISIYAGAVVGHLWVGESLLLSCFLATANTLEPLAAAGLLNRRRGIDLSLSSVRDCYRLFAQGGLVSSGIGALVGVAALTYSGRIPLDAFWKSLTIWWMGDTLGIVLVAPFILVWRQPPRIELPRLIEGAAIAGVTLLAGQIVFIDWFNEVFGQVNRGYWMYLLVTWAAIRIGAHGLLLTLLIVAVQALVGAAQGVGFFHDDLARTQLTNFWAYMTILTTVGMSVATMITELRAADRALRHSEGALRRAQHLAGLGAWSWDIRLDVHRWSEEIYRIYGRDPALPPAIYPEVRRYFTPASWARLASAVETALSSGLAYECDAEVVRPDGGSRWIMARGEAVRDNDGRVIELHGTVQDITERKRTEAALRESEERLQLFIEHAPAALAMFDRDMRYLAVSRRWLADYNLGGRNVIGCSHYGIFPEIPDYWRSVHQRALNGEVVRADEDRFVRGDGSVQWLRWEVRPWHYTNGSVGGIVVFSEDITERKTAEHALAEHEAQYRAVIETATDGFCMLDERGHILAANETYARRSGYGSDELLGMCIEDLEAQESPEEVRRHVARILRSGSDRFETWHRTKNGERWPAEIVASFWPQAGGRFFAFVRDITARKRAAEALQESEARFRGTFELAAVGIAHVSLDGRWLRINRKLCEILGYSGEELQCLTFQDITHPDDIEADLAYVQGMLAGDIQHYSMEKRYFRKDRAAIWVNLTVALARKPDASPDYFITIVEDLTERKRTEAALKALHREMERMMKFQVASQTAAAIAHELNQPLNAVAMYAEAALRLLRAGNSRSDKLQHAIEGSAQQAQRAGKVVRELLAFMNENEVVTEPLSLNGVIWHVLKRVEMDGFAGVDYRLDLDPALPPVMANRIQVEKVLINLIENGIEAMRDAAVDRRSITIRVRAGADADMAQATIIDSGPGIDAVTLRRIFEPFFTTKPRGLGMGLAISRSIIETLGGRLWAESVPGAGARFHLTLPFAP